MIALIAAGLALAGNPWGELPTGHTYGLVENITPVMHWFHVTFDEAEAAYCTVGIPDSPEYEPTTRCGFPQPPPRGDRPPPEMKAYKRAAKALVRRQESGRVRNVDATYLGTWRELVVVDLVFLSPPGDPMKRETMYGTVYYKLDPGTLTPHVQARRGYARGLYCAYTRSCEAPAFFLDWAPPPGLDGTSVLLVGDSPDRQVQAAQAALFESALDAMASIDEGRTPAFGPPTRPAGPRRAHTVRAEPGKLEVCIPVFAGSPADPVDEAEIQSVLRQIRRGDRRPGPRGVELQDALHRLASLTGDHPRVQAAHAAGALFSLGPRAKQLYDALVDSHPQDPCLARSGARAAMYVGDLEGALHLADRAIALAPDEAESHYVRAIVGRMNHLPGEPMASLRVVLTLDPDHIAALLHIGEALAREGDIEAARPYLERALSLEPSLDWVAHLLETMTSVESHP